MDTETTNPEAPEVEENVVTEEEEFEAEDSPEEESEEEDTVEIELDGKTYTVPASLKDSFLMQGDYTRKTQELAEERKALAEVKARVQQAGEAEVNAKASVIAIQSALQQYQDVDWDALEAQDPMAANRHFRQMMQLQNALGEAENQYKSAVEARTFETQQEAAKRIEQGTAVLQRDIPGWGPELATQLMSFGEKMGLARDYMESVDDPALVKLMHMAFLASKATKPAATKVEVKPAAKVKGGKQPVTGLDDRLSAEEWTRRREEQLRARK